MSMFPNYHSNLIAHTGVLNFYLAYGNGIPNQDWLGWLGYGFGKYASIDMLLIIGVLLVALYDFLRKHKIG